MATFIVDEDHQKPNLKHFCKICKKGFGCGRALGGHMRAHGIGIGLGDDTAGPMDEDDEDPASDWDDNNKPTNNPANRRMYALRTNPNRLKTCRVCENCGKEFLSWKSFLEHGKCATSDDLDSLFSSDQVSSPPCSEEEEEEEEEEEYEDEDEGCTAAGRRGSCGNHNNNGNNWSKRKRSLRVKVGSSPSPNSNEEEDLANCLMMLSNGAVDSPETEDAEAEESCASASKELDHHHHHHHLHHLHHNRNRNNNNNNNNNISMRKAINFIPPLSYRLPDDQDVKAKGVVGPTSSPSKGMFECKACKKVFNSHQALGGHRASHKKVKGCFAARLDQMEGRENDDVLGDQESLLFMATNSNNNNNKSSNNYENGGLLGASTSSKRKSKVHECSICHRIFSSGQALGGHKRCHWITSSSNPAPDTPVPPPTTTTTPISNMNHQNRFHDHHRPRPTPSLLLPLDLKLDLNLPAPSDDPRRPPFQVSTDIYLHSTWACKSDKHHLNDSQPQPQPPPPPNDVVVNNHDEPQNNPNHLSTLDNINPHVDDEADSKAKLPKLRDLKDVNMSAGNSSPWLQVGIASSTTTDVIRPDS